MVVVIGGVVVLSVVNVVEVVVAVVVVVVVDVVVGFEDGRQLAMANPWGT